MNHISILLVDDHTIVREGYRRLLELDPDFHVVGDAQNGREAVALAGKLRPDIILMDIAMPLMNGLEATRQILRAAPDSKIIILSAHGDDIYVSNAMLAGAKGFLLKQSSSNDVGRCIRSVHAGNPVLPLRSRVAKPIATLTPRESEILQLIAEGKANKESAALLRIATKTVEKHREHLMAKLDIHDTAGLTRYAIANGIIENSIQVTIV